MRYKIVFIFLILIYNTALGQKKYEHVNIEGVVFSFIDGKNDTPLLGAKVHLLGAKKEDVTNEKGSFFIHNMEITLPDTLVISAMGHYADTIIIKGAENNSFKITLYPQYVAETVVIQAKRSNTSILRLDPRNVQNLTQGELRKAACCSLSESFATNATVDVNLADGISGSKRIQMMGLDGRYTQLQFENIPFMNNLDRAFGLSSVPGTWIESIQITKGSGTVVNGYEPMVGLINLEFLKPKTINRLFINGYGNMQGRAELNIQGGTLIGKQKKWGTAWFVHGSSQLAENDRNKDGFRDMPLGERFVGMNRWEYSGALFEGQFGVKLSYANKFGGQMGYGRSRTLADNGLYGLGIHNLNAEVFGKTGFMFENHVNTSIGIVYYGKYDQLNTYFGHRKLDALEKRGYINGMFETILGNTNHKLKSGVSLVYDDLDQTMQDVLPTDTATRILDRTEVVPGIFAEYAYSGIRSTLVLGARTDYHNLYGWQFNPRVNYKLRINEFMDIRATAGRGFRVSNYAIDYMPLMATNTPWIVDKNIAPEVSWNFGGSWIWNFKLFSHPASWTIDYYYTMFTNQLIADRDASTSYIHIGNLDGKSYSHALQTNFKFQPITGFTIKAAYKFLDVRETTGDVLRAVIMVPKHRGFINFEYETKNQKWSYDLTMNVYGKQRLAQVALADGTLTKDNLSEAMPMLDAQVTYHFKNFDIYLGGENLLDRRLKNPIIDVENPFGQHFDATRVYNSIFGINVYLGFRFMLPQKEKSSMHMEGM